MTAELLGDPQFAFPVIHVTGTNGKTSTVRIIERILREYGLRTGRMQSPHLVRLNERIAIDGEPVEDEILIEAWDDIAPILEFADSKLAETNEPPLTFFESLTLLTMQIFADTPVDVAIIEVGMGGEWDSTNIVKAEVAVFAPIDLDHKKQLGNTISEIAATKSGIIKQGSIVVSSEQRAEAKVQLEKKSDLAEIYYFGGESFKVLSSKREDFGQRLSVQGIAANYEHLFLPLVGNYQAENAALAIAAAETFIGGGRPLSEAIVHAALADSTSPGRLQIISKEPLIIFDAAHNPQGAISLAAAIRNDFELEDTVMVFAVMQDKDYRAMLKHLAPVVSKMIITEVDTKRSLAADVLSEAAAEFGIETVIEKDAKKAFQLGQEIADANLASLFVAGSIYLLGELISGMTQEVTDAE